MNSDCEVEVLFCDALQNGNGKALSDLTRMWTEEVEANYFAIVCLVDHNLRITVMHSVFVEIPLQRLIDATVGNYVICSELLPCVLFTVAHAAVLYRSEDSCSNIFVAH